MSISLPSMMQAVIFDQPGNPDVLKLSSIPIPVPRRNEVLIKVEAAGINRPDIVQRQGNYPPPKNANPHLGLEIAGEIVSSPSNSHFSIGDKVCALTNGGGYAQYCSVPYVQCLPWPKQYNAIKAAALPETFFTVWTNLFAIGNLKPNDSLLIHGGSGGIGTTAIQLAKAFGATIYTTVGTEEKGSFCKKLGATDFINYKKDNFYEKIKSLTNKQGVNLILDIMGASYFSDNIKSLSEEGRLVIISFQGGIKAENVNLGLIAMKRVTVTGSTLRPRDTKFKGKIARALHKHVWPLLDTGIIEPQVFKIFPFEQVRKAHQLMESNKHIGKIVLDLSQFSD
ncbi:MULTISPECIES: NAD(P)H-quinone oxidoreductase [Commensalibacter]|uniref:NAD(P)H-quinone oxidoreductase n=1 Tax=Commensalibacter TaxID=1079922 RepID=UPI001D9F5F4B|nr:MULTISPECIES: NAD(P)H-quinone oxidoreductase [Commensalibacter]MCT6852476.1 NAD(P)H-quinone oxidoreductase [Commensalibacter sp.]MBH9972574.1 NAD(P)H-quinone oxidoreductase [Commensalibacter melissae]MBI0016894.1 NAD(P)H-quinone oxidoreductase [Commensalibacter sp. B14384M2]MBI0018639.1 NAD(P)H-quinone oxidoreductase [Commensalibacter sp. W8133]MBI0049979.1 NAD(P)H-quinone oxidoreductase [Commensalibacter sp. B14384M3]